jgi:hypothetical protein
MDKGGEGCGGDNEERREIKKGKNEKKNRREKEK